MRSNLSDVSSPSAHPTASKAPPMVVAAGDGWVLCAEVGMTINLYQ